MRVMRQPITCGNTWPPMNRYSPTSLPPCVSLYFSPVVVSGLQATGARSRHCHVLSRLRDGPMDAEQLAAAAPYSTPQYHAGATPARGDAWRRVSIFCRELIQYEWKLANSTNVNRCGLVTAKTEPSSCFAFDRPSLSFSCTGHRCSHACHPIACLFSSSHLPPNCQLIE